jgi:hypothetical protein
MQVPNENMFIGKKKKKPSGYYIGRAKMGSATVGQALFKTIQKSKKK